MPWFQVGGYVSINEKATTDCKNKTFQSSYAQEIIREIKDSGYKSDFASEMQNSLSNSHSETKMKMYENINPVYQNQNALDYFPPKNQTKLCVKKNVEMDEHKNQYNTLGITEEYTQMDVQLKTLHCRMNNRTILTPRERLSTISRVETVLSLNQDEHKQEQRIRPENQMEKINLDEAKYFDLQEQLTELHQQLNKVKMYSF